MAPASTFRKAPTFPAPEVPDDADPFSQSRRLGHARRPVRHGWRCRGDVPVPVTTPSAVTFTRYGGPAIASTLALPSARR